MTNRSRVVLAGFLGLILATPALADPPVPGACPKPKTVIVSSRGPTLTFGEADGLICNVFSSNSGSFQMYGLLLQIGSELATDEVKQEVAKLWPLESGKSTQFVFTRRNQHWLVKVTVSDKRTITVKAGTFEVFPVVLDEQWMGFGTSHVILGNYPVDVAHYKI